MLKQTVTYEDFNGNEQTDELYFHLSKAELAEMLELEERFDAIQKNLDGPDRELTPEEIREVLSILKYLISRSYGVRSEDGKRFAKTPEILRDFEQSAVYDEFLFGLFENGGKDAVDFMLGVMPKSLVEQARAQLNSGDEGKSMVTANLPDDEVPAWMRENRDPTPEELRKMDRDEIALAFKRKADKANSDSQA